MFRKIKLSLQIFCLAFSFFFAPRAHAASFSGHVYEDKNSNGRYDTTDPIIPNVMVSNGTQVVATDGYGAYVLPAITSGFITVTKPEGFYSSAWYVPVTQNIYTYDFSFVPATKTPSSFSFLQITDLHIGLNEATNNGLVASRVKTAITQIFNSHPLHPVFLVIIGDLTDKTGPTTRFQTAKEALSVATLPVYPVLGNHDNNLSTYMSLFGPLNYSFEYGSWHFLVFDNSTLNPLNTTWLSNDLALATSRGKKTLIFAHTETMDSTLWKNTSLRALIYGHIHNNTNAIIASDSSGDQFKQSTAPLAYPGQYNGYRTFTLSSDTPFTTASTAYYSINFATLPSPSPSPTPNATPLGDADQDHDVDLIDYSYWLTYYGTSTSSGVSHGDFNQSGQVDLIDYSLWLANYTN